MEFYVVIPAHNEASFLAATLDSLLKQSKLPKKVIIVNDNSTDTTEEIIDSFALKSHIFKKLNIRSNTAHMPGSKVINAFNAGASLLDNSYDFIVKLDADILLPSNYFETIANHFNLNKKIGIVGGYIYEQDINGNWSLNHPMDKNHIRGAFKAYSKACLQSIGGLKNAMGWDTVDELLAQYHGYTLKTDQTLHVKHLRPTGKDYSPEARRLQGKAMFTMRYGLLLTVIASVKMAYKKRSLSLFFNNIQGYSKAKSEKANYLVTIDEGDYIRKLRWKNIKSKIFLKKSHLL